MSRGGGGARGGRGGSYGGPAGARLNHGTMPFEIDLELLANVEKMHKDSGLFPQMNVPKPRPLGRAELATVDAYRELRAKRHLGPYYFPSTTGDVEDRKPKRLRLSRADERSAFNAFEDQKTYFNMQEGVRRAYKEAQFSKLPFVKDFMPKELWGICGLAEGPEYWPVLNDRKSLLSMTQKLARIDDADDLEDKDLEDDKDDLDSNKDPDDEDKDEDADAEEQDDDFEDGEDDMAADYNAEQYFDGGEDDNDDLGGGGDGGGGDDW